MSLQMRSTNRVNNDTRQEIAFAVLIFGFDRTKLEMMSFTAHDESQCHGACRILLAERIQ